MDVVSKIKAELKIYKTSMRKQQRGTRRRRPNTRK